MSRRYRHTLAGLCVLPFLLFSGLVLPVLLFAGFALPEGIGLLLVGAVPLLAVMAAGFAWGVQVLVNESPRH